MACGSTGEFTSLSSDERRLVVETVVDQTARRVPVIAQTGATYTAEAIRLSRHAQAVGADVIMPVAPYYEALSVEETLTYLRAVAGSVDIPVMVYNLPMATGVDLHPDTVGALAREVENIRYIKNTTIDMAQSACLIHNHGDVLSTFVGWDSLAAVGPGRGRRGGHGGDGERRAERARGRLRRRERGRPGGRPEDLGSDLPTHRGDHGSTVHRGGQGRPGGGGLPRRRPASSGRTARPRRGRPDRATGEDDNYGGDDGNCQRNGEGGGAAGTGLEASSRTASFLSVSTSSTEHSGPAGPARSSTSSTPPPSARSPRSPRARPRTPTPRWRLRTPRRTRGVG